MRAARGQSTPKRRVFRNHGRECRSGLTPEAWGPRHPRAPSQERRKRKGADCPEDRNDRGRGTRRDNVRCLNTHLVLGGREGVQPTESG